MGETTLGVCTKIADHPEDGMDGIAEFLQGGGRGCWFLIPTLKLQISSYFTGTPKKYCQQVLGRKHNFHQNHNQSGIFASLQHKLLPIQQ